MYSYIGGNPALLNNNNAVSSNAKNYNTNDLTYTGSGADDTEEFFGYGTPEADRRFQAYMSNTQYQRAVRDMKMAGLNPGLMFGSANAAQGGTPTGGSSGKGLKMITDGVMSIASIFSNTAKVMKAVHDFKTDKALAQNAINISQRIGFRK